MSPFVARNPFEDVHWFFWPVLIVELTRFYAWLGSFGEEDTERHIIFSISWWGRITVRWVEPEVGPDWRDTISGLHQQTHRLAATLMPRSSSPVPKLCRDFLCPRILAPLMRAPAGRALLFDSS